MDENEDVKHFFYSEIEKLSGIKDELNEEISSHVELRELVCPMIISPFSDLSIKDIDTLFDLSSREGWNISPTEQYGNNSLLELASALGNTNLVNHLLTNIGGFNLNEKYANGEYALFCALHKANDIDDMGRSALECAALLIEHGSSLDLISRDGKTVKEYIESKGIEEDINRAVVDLRLRKFI